MEAPLVSSEKTGQIPMRVGTGQITRLPGKSGKFILKGSRDKINDLIDKYNKEKKKTEKEEILSNINIAYRKWFLKVNNDFGKKDKSDDHLARKLQELEDFGEVIEAEFDWIRGKVNNSPRKPIPEIKVDFGEKEKVAQSMSPDKIYQIKLCDELKGMGYRGNVGDVYWDKMYGVGIPHVGWKAHIGTTEVNASDVIRRASAILDKYNCPHKVDTTCTVFKGKNKFITIYPPKDERTWEPLIDELEDTLGNNMVAIDKELKVGKTGLIGMRNGQLSAFSFRMLSANNIAFEGINQSFNSIRLTNPSQYDPSVKDGIIVLGDRGAYFTYDTRYGNMYCPVMLFNGKIYPDPREDPNPNGFDLPTGLRAFRG